MNTPDTEVDAYSRGYKQGRFDSEMDRLNEEKPTPDTEDWEKEFDFKAIKEYWGLHIGPKSTQHMQEKVLHKIYLKLTTSRDTYWKERVRKEVEAEIQLFMETLQKRADTVPPQLLLNEVVNYAYDRLQTLDNLK